MKAVFLEDEEKSLLESYERDEWRPVKNPREEIKGLKEYARNTLFSEQVDRSGMVNGKSE
jgi:hypothetical protein